VAGLLAGSDKYSGAVVLSTGGAIRGGAGMIRVVTAPSAAAAVRQAWPEVILTPFDQLPGGDPVAAGRVQAWIAGPGMGTTDDAAERLASVLAADVPVLVDADGLTLLAGPLKAAARARAGRGTPTLITPHAGELARLLGGDTDAGRIAAHRLEHARRAAEELGCTVLLKGSTTVIASPGQDTVLVNPTGTPWLATAGSGDVLSGLAGSLLAQGLPPAGAAIAGAYLHGLAARLAAGGPGDAAAEAPIGAFDVVMSLPDAIRAVGG